MRRVEFTLECSAYGRDPARGGDLNLPAGRQIEGPSCHFTLQSLNDFEILARADPQCSKVAFYFKPNFDTLVDLKDLPPTRPPEG